MKRICIILILMLNFSVSGQTLEGSWELIEENGLEISDKEIIRIYQDGYFAEAAKEENTNEFLYALGGEYDEKDYSVTLDFNTKSPEAVGITTNPKLKFLDQDTIQINEVTFQQVWKRVSSDKNDLDGNWVITGRKRNGEMNTMSPGDRRTVKILGGDRFQWIAFNSATKEFYGTGGGTYTAKNGDYTENITVFSRDKDRVGASLGFGYELKDGKWHHSGESSKGDPIYEIWSPYASAYKKWSTNSAIFSGLIYQENP